MDRRKQGLKRSVAVEAGGIPLAAVPTRADQRDDGVLAATLETIGVVARWPPSRSCTGLGRRLG